MIAVREYAYIRDLVRERSALVLEPGKEYFVESRLHPIAIEEGFSSTAQLIERLRGNPFGHLHQKVVEAMTINETSFFRDLRAFDVLKTMVLPRILKNRSECRVLNVWSAACSNGQEPYSFAILLREYFPSVLGWKIHVIASDISREALVRARHGRYTQLEVNRGLPVPFLSKYFKKQDNAWQLNPEARIVRFDLLAIERAGSHLSLAKHRGWRGVLI